MEENGLAGSDVAGPRIEGMPVLGLGTWKATDVACTEAVRFAVDLGYRHVDTAHLYRNEAAVGAGIAAAEVDREELFVATKLYVDELGYRDVLDGAGASLDRLGLDYLDLLYVHWPAGSYDPEETLAAFSDLHDDEVIAHVGVSNFEPEQVDLALEECDVPIFANQVEMHPLLQQPDLRDHCVSAGVHLVAYAPLAREAVFGVPELVDVAGKHGVTEAVVSLAWLRQKGVAAIPKAVSEAHIRENWSSLDLTLDAEDVAAIDAIGREERQVDPHFAPWRAAHD